MLLDGLFANLYLDLYLPTGTLLVSLLRLRSRIISRGAILATLRSVALVSPSGLDFFLLVSLAPITTNAPPGAPISLGRSSSLFISFLLLRLSCGSVRIRLLFASWASATPSSWTIGSLLSRLRSLSISSFVRPSLGLSLSRCRLLFRARLSSPASS